MRDYFDIDDAKPSQLTREDLKTMRPQDITKAREEGRFRDILTLDRRDPPQGRDNR